MTSRSPANWSEVIKDKTDGEIARFLTADLTGYRSSSIHRADDEDSIRHLIKAIRMQQAELEK